MRTMPQYLMPGVATTRTSSRRTGAAAVLVAAVVAAGWLAVPDPGDGDRMRVTLRTEQLADGVTAGTTVRARGIAIGEITAVVPVGAGDFGLELALDPTRVFELDDSLAVDFVPANLFGMSEVELIAGPGGAPLRDGGVVDLTGPRATEVYDATTSALMRVFSDAVGGVLTPQLTTALYQLSHAVGAFTPLLRTVIALATAVADTQRLPASQLAAEYGRMLTGAGEFTAATVEVFDVIRSNQPLREDRPHFDATVNAVVDGLLPAAIALGGAGQRYASGYAAAVVPLLRTVGASVAHPQMSSAELRELLARLHRAFSDSPDGPVLATSIAVRGVPVLAQTLPTAALPSGQGR
ncbi:mammalian cell entry protein [Nocardia farcinica]|uniref:mammalian cell entry protein n=1 Tax=Nocardia farcinica TaxID=37329 RepID=UPI001894F8D2|nr:mammalian cell entry protein [Nocardia farcinica]MBF6183642.1 mammalian cell entry protein [Nocardia farcinica]MBF6309485.1 mammalian cell entry protein [Nocardia farcinica]MBF6406693.1 mammalian cell entry protein [Nocardia farcinica]UEX20546.1 mammalian cell entry protein [Nocardia farcinica]